MKGLQWRTDDSRQKKNQCSNSITCKNFQILLGFQFLNLLNHGRVQRVIFQSTLIDSTSHFDVAAISPAGSPGIADNPIVDAIQSSIADDYNGMID